MAAYSVDDQGFDDGDDKDDSSDELDDDNGDRFVECSSCERRDHWQRWDLSKPNEILF